MAATSSPEMNQTRIHFCLVCSRVIPDSQLGQNLLDDPSICSCESDSDSMSQPNLPSTPPSNPPPPVSQDSTGKLPPSEQRDAALAVRRWAKTWMSEFGLVYPACVNEMRFKEAVVIYKHHKMDKEMVERIVDTRVKSVRDSNSKKIAFAVSRDSCPRNWSRQWIRWPGWIGTQGVSVVRPTARFRCRLRVGVSGAGRRLQ